MKVAAQNLIQNTNIDNGQWVLPFLQDVSISILVSETSPLYPTQPSFLFILKPTPFPLALPFFPLLLLAVP